MDEKGERCLAVAGIVFVLFRGKQIDKRSMLPMPSWCLLGLLLSMAILVVLAVIVAATMAAIHAVVSAYGSLN